MAAKEPAASGLKAFLEAVFAADNGMTDSERALVLASILVGYINPTPRLEEKPS